MLVHRLRGQDAWSTSRHRREARLSPKMSIEGLRNMTENDRGPTPKETIEIINQLVARGLINEKKFEEMHHFTKRGKRGGTLARFLSYCGERESFTSDGDNDKLARELQKMLHGQSRSGKLWLGTTVGKFLRRIGGGMTKVTEILPALSMTEAERILGFLGYGNPRQSVWFVGIEEGLGKADSADAKENLKARGEFDAIMDLRDAHHQRLRQNGMPINFDANPPSTPVWHWIAKIMRAYEGKDNWRDTSSAKEYIRCCLGRSNGTTFLTELSPIPSSKTANKSWMKAFNELDSELHQRLAKRQERLLLLLKNSAPRMVICYGDGRVKAQEYERFFGVEWSSIGMRVARDSSYPYPFLLLPFFGNGQMSQPVIEEMFKLGILQGGER